MFTLYNGDCLEVMPTLPAGSIDAIITDLPYGTTSCKWDVIIPLVPMWKEVKRVLKPRGAFITTASQPFTSALVMSNPKWFRYEIIWDKVGTSGFLNANKMPLKSHENVLIFYEHRPTYNPQKEKREKSIRHIRNYNTGKEIGNSGVYRDGIKRFTSEGYETDWKHPKSIISFSVGNGHTKKKNQHPTQKPVALYEYLVRTYTNPGETVLDICMGSGTTIEAAERTGRNSIGIEKDEAIFQSAVLRIASIGRTDQIAMEL